jgi:hypothetical protein
LFDELTTHILRRLEAFPDATFRESELASVSKESFDALVREGNLLFDRYDKNGDAYISDHMGDGDNERFLRIKDGQISAFSTDPEVATLHLTKPEITYYRFDRTRFIDRLKNANDLKGEADPSLSDRLSYIGTDFITNSAVLLGFFNDEKEVSDELLSLWSKIPPHDNALVICPSFALSSQRSKKTLADVGVVLASFDRALDKNFKMDLRKFGLKQRDVSGPERKTAQIKSDYKKYGYKSDETITFHNRQDSGGYIVQEGHIAEVGIPQANYVLLLFMAMTLKQNKQGLLSAKETDALGITDEQGDENRLSYLISDLRKSFRNKRLIETIRGTGQYRISTHPDNIKADLAWLKKKLEGLLPKVKQERYRRKK